ncbi:cyclodeaminase/cyclohydrolase family protein [bacterium]|nr:cyclodeaminase/cyclohydrolase family protein [bacterium]
MSLIARNVSEFLNELASSSPAPGGGSVSALAGALGTALIAMVSHLTIGKKKYAPVENGMKSTLDHSEQLRSKLTKLIDKDTDAFNLVMSAFAMPKDTDEQKNARAAAIESATKEATMVPLDVMNVCREAVELSEFVAHNGNTNALSDAGVAALLLRAGCRGAYYNVKINLASLKDTGFIEKIRLEASVIMEEVDTKTNAVMDHVESQLA